MDRRAFLHRMSRWGLAGLAGIAYPDTLARLVWAEDPFSMGERGQNLIAAGKYREAISILQRAVALDPGSDLPQARGKTKGRKAHEPPRETGAARGKGNVAQTSGPN
ncbi:MAG: tetratricopeptide repeat protein [Deltaproteobacteria bacterium]|nr:tetratricopeptide repeat protein [Deltaproteobacteria bacterium]